MPDKHILWLVSWYPNADDPFDGDFIQRHARAAALHNRVHVLFVKPIRQLPAASETVVRSGNLTEQRIYIKKEHGVLKKWHRQWVWLRTYKNAIASYIAKNGLPHLVHVQVPWRAGLLALWVKQKYKVPYLITEHWGIYNNVVEDRFSVRPFWMQQLFKTIYRQAAMLVSVSTYLAKNINRHVASKPFVVIPNVVDTSLFFYVDKKPKGFVLLHVSNMVPLKNVNGILEAFALFQQEVPEAQLVLIGNKDDVYPRYANNLRLDKSRVQFRGEVPYAAVAAAMQQAHGLIVNSLIENAPCVIGEALCCGVPVIATAVGGIPELVPPGNGILIEPSNTQALAEAMRQLYHNYQEYNRYAIAATAQKTYGVETIAHRFDTLYASITTDR